MAGETTNGTNGQRKTNGKATYSEKHKIADHFIGGNRLEKAPAGKVKDFVAQNDGHTVITNVSSSWVPKTSFFLCPYCSECLWLSFTGDAASHWPPFLFSAALGSERRRNPIFHTLIVLPAFRCHTFSCPSRRITLQRQPLENAGW